VTTSLPQKENAFIGQHRYSEYAKWHLGIDEEKGTTPSAGTSSLMGFQDECIVVRYSLRNAGQYSAKLSISKTRRGAFAWHARRPHGRAEGVIIANRLRKY
jgi:hypothetical protein